MRSLRLLAALVLAISGALTAGVAHAETASFTDPAGDGRKGKHLDITTITVSNRDHLIVVTVSFVKVASGDFYLGIRQRGRGPRGEVVVISLHRAHSDTNSLRSIDGVETCRGFRVTWDAVKSRVRVRIPSRCVTNGDYGAIKAQAIAEIGSDADFAPKTRKGGWGWTDWVGRG